MSQTKTKSKTGADKKGIIDIHVSSQLSEYEKAMRKTWACGDTCNTKQLRDSINNDPNTSPLEKHAIQRMKLSECKLQDCMPHIMNQLKLQIDYTHLHLQENIAALAAIKGRKEMHITYYRSLLQKNIKTQKKDIRRGELFMLKAERNKVKPIDIVNMFMI
jgi:hypothetical protein